LSNAGQSENRSAPRRSGSQIKVTISNPTTKKVLMEGWVMDRSQGGLNLLVPAHMVPATIVNVRRTAATRNTAPVQIEVRRCVQKGVRYQLGCKFVGNPSEKTLAQFG
jgi:hypothetical protein